MVFVVYFILIFLVVFLSIKIGDSVDLIDKKTNLSGAFIGGVVLAATTSLPEFFTSISAVTVIENAGLVMGNIFGSNIFNIASLAMIILFFVKKFSLTNLSKNHSFGAAVLILITAILFFFPNIFITTFGNRQLNLKSILIIILYIFVIKSLSQENSSSHNSKDPRPDLSTKDVIFRFLILSVVMISCSIVLTYVSDIISAKINLNATVAGAILLGVATSLPEIVSSITLSKIGNFNAVVGNIVGSNMFNVTILSVVDLISKQNLYISSKSSNILIIFSLLNTIILYIILFNKNKGNKNTKLYSFLSILIVLVYLCFMVIGH